MSAPNQPRPGSGDAAAVTVRRCTLGPYQTNCYVVRPAGYAGCWVIDASFDPEPLIRLIGDEGGAPEALILTHAHVDHLAGVAEVRRAYPSLPIWAHRTEEAWLSDPVLNLSEFGGQAITAPAATRLLDGGETLALGPTTWSVLHTPGHSPGGITLYCPAAGVALVGDALFAGSIGRTDFPGSSLDQLTESIRSRLYTLPATTRVLPGHGPSTTIGREAQSNPFVRA